MKYLLTLIILLMCLPAMADDSMTIHVPPLDKEECIRTYEAIEKYGNTGNVWEGLMWDEDNQLCYAKITSTTDEWVKVYIDKEYHLTVEQGKGPK